MKKLLLLILLGLCNTIFSQDKGIVQGVVTDKEMNNEPLPFVNVYIKGTDIGGTTDMNGTFKFQVPAGKQILIFRFMGYQNIEKPINVVATKTTIVNQVMSVNEGQQLDEVEIQAITTKEKESALLLEQKKAIIIKESIGAVELSKKGVSNAEGATTKISGVSKSEGSSKVFVRGLGDRYNTTTLNGLPLPSNNPSNKNITLSLFSTNIIQNIGVNKSFDASISGDVSGANIDIISKEFSGKSNISVSFGAGGNSQTTFKEYKSIDNTNWFGIANHTKHKVTDLTTLTFTDKFTPNKKKVTPLNTSFSISGGKRFNFKNSSSLSMFLAGNFANNYHTKDGFSVNILNSLTDANGNITGFTEGSNYHKALEYKYETNKILMGIFTYKINANHKISFNSLFIHTNSQKIQEYLGTKPDVADTDGELAYNVLQTENQNRLLVNQLLSEHRLKDNLELNVGLSYNLINNDEPNRKKNIFKINTIEKTTQLASGTPRNNSRYYHNLAENDINAMVTLTRYFGEKTDNKGNIKIGYTFRNTQRNFASIYFDYNLARASIVENNNSDNILNQQGLNNNIFKFQTGRGRGNNALEPFTYNAFKQVHSAFTNVSYKFSDKFLASAGIRFEKINLNVEWNTNLGNSDIPQPLNRNYFLPSFNLKYSFTNNNLLRLSASKTYTYSQFKEIAPFMYEGVNYSEYGNKELKPSENYNIDLKWELFPTRDELISATVFTKIINNAINRIEINAGSDNIFSFYNTGNSKVYGAEIEIKKNLFTINEENNEKLKLGFNATYMYNNQIFKRTNIFNPTNNNDPLEGASPILVNADITYNKKIDDKEINASLVFNYQHTKLYSIGTVNGLKGIYEKSVPKLDFILKRKFNKKLEAKLSIKNILNPKIERYRALPTNPITRSYRNGINFSVGLNYKL